VAALERLAEALGMKLTVDITPPDDIEPDPTPAERPAMRSDSSDPDAFRTEVARLAERAGLPDRAAHQRLVALLAAAQAAAGTELVYLGLSTPGGCVGTGQLRLSKQTSESIKPRATGGPLPSDCQEVISESPAWLDRLSLNTAETPKAYRCADLAKGGRGSSCCSENGCGWTSCGSTRCGSPSDA